MGHCPSLNPFSLSARGGTASDNRERDPGERRFIHEKRRDKEALLELELSLKPLPEMQEDSYVQLCQREASVPAT